MVNKRAWVKIVEASFAIILIASVIIFVINNYYEPQNISKEIYVFEEGVLNGIKINSTLRTDVLKIGEADLPANQTYIEANSPLLANYLVPPPYLTCEFVICLPGYLCGIDKKTDKELFGKSTILAAEGDYTDSRVLNLFCWIE